MNQPRRLCKELVQGVLLIPAFFVLACAALLLGIGLYVWTWEPQRLATKAQSERLQTIVQPQPSQVLPGETNLFICMPRAEIGSLAAMTLSRIWSRGKAFTSGGSAAADHFLSAWRIWLLCIFALVCGRVFGLPTMGFWGASLEHRKGVLRDRKSELAEHFKE